MAHLNNTAAIAARPLREGGRVSQSVRKIDNGYIVENSSYDERTGQYKCSEEFAKEPPNGLRSTGGRGGVGPEGLADTKKYLGSDV